MAADPLPFQRPLGAWPIDDELTQFRVWAPAAGDGLQLALGDRRPELLEMTDAGYGVWELTTAAAAGTDYRFVVNNRRLPDPCSRFQPGGLKGPSRVVGAAGHGASGSSRRFRAAPMSSQVIYELHVGTFSPEGTFAGAIPYLEGLAALGITAIELMPVGEFPGTRGWGYDGVYISAPQSSYGGPAGLTELVAGAHSAGLAVILDVVYNHVGPGSDALARFGPYFTDKYATPWGSAVNYDDAGCDPVREWACQSAEGWIRDYGIDGLRLDAVHAIYDSGPEHLVAEIARRVRAINPRTMLIAESALNDPKVMRPARVGGWACDATWSDDFHHSVRTLVSDEHEGYYADFGTLADLAKAMERPFVYDGTYSTVREKFVGAPALDRPPSAFVVCSQNHDQVGNRAFGDRMPAPARALAAMLTLFSPFVPMLFMGEEYAEPAPFQYFVDHIDPKIAEATRKGRRAEFAAFASFGHEVPDPMAEVTFTDSKLTRAPDPAIAELYRRLLALRGDLPAGDVSEVAYDEADRWLHVRRGDWVLVASFADAETTHPGRGLSLELGTSDAVSLSRGRLTLPALSGAILKRKDTT